MIKSPAIYLVLLLTISISVKGQYYETGQDPSSLKWLKLKSDHFLFIYPESYDLTARKTAVVFENALTLMKGRYGEPEIKNFPVILHSYSIESNGYVAWAPKRIELFPLPGQDNIPMSHLDQLALHELTHVLQIQGFRKGISKPLSYIFGEQYTGALSIYTPFWFLEGDAVISETAYSLSGRGRQPAFEKKLRAMLLDNEKPFSYDKMISGSLKDIVPNHYQFGYQMTAWTVSNYGRESFSKSIDKIARMPYSIDPFNISLVKNTGHTKKKIYHETMDFLRQKWSEEDKANRILGYDTLNPNRGKDQVNYYSPVSAGNGNIYAIRTSLYDVPRIVEISNNGNDEKVIFTPGYIWPFRINYSNGKIVWAESHNDPRWDNRGYSILKYYNIENKITHQITTKTRLFSPDISPDGILVVSSSTSPSYENHLIITELNTGTEISKLPTPDNIMAAMPSWSENQKYIIFISYSDNGEGIVSYNTFSGEWKRHMEDQHNDLQSVRMRNDSIFFVSSLSGIDNVYCLTPAGDMVRLTSSRFGISSISLDGENLLFSYYTSGGYNIGSQKIDSSFPAEIVSDLPKQLLMVGKIDQEEKLLSPETVEIPERYTISKYRKGLHLFNFHSWMPFYSDIDDISVNNPEVNPGVTVMSQNHLSTLISTLGYEFNSGVHLLHSKITWKGWYPAIDFELTYGGSPVILQSDDVNVKPSIIYPGLKASGLIYLPLRFSNSRFTQTVWPSLRFSYTNNYVYEEITDLYDYGQSLLTSRIYFSNFHRMAARDIWPRWGQVVDYHNIFSPGDPEIYGPSNSLSATLYFPGLFRNHGIKLRYQFEKQNFKKLLLYNRASFPRGYNDIISEELKSFTADYTMPLVYPDFNIRNLIYIIRFRSAFFYDFSRGNENYYIEDKELINGEEKFSSAGTELLADFYLFRIPFRFSAGVQAAYLPFEERTCFKALFNIDIFGFVINKDKHLY
ncbi:MAG: hypothetical protein K8R35_06510 [Bacteroidales bacterium]|nr:hypothetical protein [Bacteroidales bacterium]